MANKGIDDEIKSYFESNNKRHSRVMKLKQWLALKNKSFSLMDAMRCIFLEADGSYNKVDELLDKLTFEHKTFGRTQVYNRTVHGDMDIIYDEKGNLKITGLEKYKEENPQGQHREDTGGFTQAGDKGKPRIKTEKLVKDLEKQVLELYPGQHTQYIYMAMKTIRDYAAQKKKTTDYVIKLLKKGRIVLDDDIWRIKPNVQNENKNRKVIVINESDFSKLVGNTEMTEHKFHSNIRRFISQLLEDPVNAQPSDLFKLYGYRRSNLLKYLLSGKNPILIRKERISDRDENGEPKTATMMVKFMCPKKDFDRKLQKLFIKLFERNLPPRKHKDKKINETDCCSIGGGGEGNFQNAGYVTNMFPVQSRGKIYKPKDKDKEE